MTIHEDEPQQAEQSVTETRSPYGAAAPTSRDTWDWVQLIGLGLLAAGVAVLAGFALTIGGR